MLARIASEPPPMPKRASVRMRNVNALTHVVPEDDEEHERRVEEVAVEVLEDERELAARRSSPCA